MNRERGVAIISVLLTVALATIIVSGLFLREHITVRSVTNRVDLTQARWIERAAIDWSKVILAADLKGGNEDHLGEPWAIPVLDTRLDETVTAGAKIDDDARAATLSGQMIDAQSMFNLNNLILTSAENGVGISPANVQAFQKLLSMLDLPEAIAPAVAGRLLAAAQPPSQDGEPAGALPMLRVNDLLSVRGVTPEVVQALEPFVIFIPTSQPTKVNANTAPAEVLAAIIEDLDLSAAQQFVTQRERSFLRNLQELNDKLRKNVQADLVDFRTSYFLVRGLIRFGRVESFTETLLHRQSQSNVRVIWQRRL
ncbi:MAG: type II secretion system minor pseudopilin GspK [Burkholderiaceae bacterium]